ncbi:MAG: tRNA lysidine(34) synthetase TilS [Caldithrix sp.]|nr:tRNA lysidine(34) synthetase TilS [Caldithrix sp.]
MNDQTKATSSSLLQQVYEIIKQYQLIYTNDVIYVGFSGGGDSTALVHILLNLKNKIQFTLKAIHVNHGVRDSANLDEEFVKKFCAQYSIPLEVTRISGLNKESTEDDMRQARYEKFDTLLLNKDPKKNIKVALGHQLNDQIETYLMRLAHGATLRGLKSIPIQRGPYIRPLLYTSRNVLQQYLEDNHLSYCNDLSNQDMNKLRNSIRHQVVKSLENLYGERLYRGFAKSYRELDESVALLESFETIKAEQNIQKKEDGLHLPLTFWNSLVFTEKRFLVDYCVYSYYQLNYKFTEKQAKAFDHFCQFAEIGTNFTADSFIRILKNRNEVIFTKSEAGEREQKSVLYPGQTIIFLGKTITAEYIEKNEIKLSADVRVEYICADHLKWPLQVRTWREGDIFYPLGTEHRQKVSDLFINAKVSKALKHKIPIICSNQQIVWIAGYRLDERFKVTDNCIHHVRLKIDKPKGN